MELGTLLLILAFVLIGVGVVALAMRSGRRRPAQRNEYEGRGARIAQNTGLAVACLVIGLAIPAVVIINNSETSAEDGPGGVDLTAQQAEARKTFAISCGNCHTLEASASVGRVGPNLDVMRPPKELVLDAIKNGRARGQGQMPPNLLTGQEAEEVSEYVEAVAGRGVDE